MSDQSRTGYPRARQASRGAAGGRGGAGGFAGRRRVRGGWRGTVALLLLSAIPVIAGAVRLTELGGGAAVTPGNARFFAMPLPVVAHIIGASVFTIVGAFQFAPGLRRRSPRWHRIAGRVVAPCGVAAALSGMWMTLFSALPEGDGALLGAFRILFGSAMAVFIVLGIGAVRRRDLAGHRAWMIRGYAIGQGAGSQALILGPWLLVAGPPGELPRALLLAAAWVINLAVGEWIIRGRPAIRAARA